jgi:hypothetical protein
MVATPKLIENAREFMRKAHYWFDHFQNGYDVLVNVVDERNTVSRRWLKHLGCVFMAPVTLGPFDLTFIPFMRISHV